MKLLDFATKVNFSPTLSAETVADYVALLKSARWTQQLILVALFAKSKFFRTEKQTHGFFSSKKTDDPSVYPPLANLLPSSGRPPAAAATTTIGSYVTNPFTKFLSRIINTVNIKRQQYVGNSKSEAAKEPPRVTELDLVDLILAATEPSLGTKEKDISFYGSLVGIQQEGLLGGGGGRRERVEVEEEEEEEAEEEKEGATEEQKKEAAKKREEAAVRKQLDVYKDLIDNLREKLYLEDKEADVALYDAIDKQQNTIGVLTEELGKLRSSGGDTAKLLTTKLETVELQLKVKTSDNLTLSNDLQNTRVLNDDLTEKNAQLVADNKRLTAELVIEKATNQTLRASISSASTTPAIDDENARLRLELASTKQALKIAQDKLTTTSSSMLPGGAPPPPPAAQPPPPAKQPEPAPAPQSSPPPAKEPPPPAPPAVPPPPVVEPPSNPKEATSAVDFLSRFDVAAIEKTMISQLFGFLNKDMLAAVTVDRKNWRVSPEKLVDGFGITMPDPSDKRRRIPITAPSTELVSTLTVIINLWLYNNGDIDKVQMATNINAAIGQEPAYIDAIANLNQKGVPDRVSVFALVRQCIFPNPGTDFLKDAGDLARETLDMYVPNNPSAQCGPMLYLIEWLYNFYAENAGIKFPASGTDAQVKLYKLLEPFLQFAFHSFLLASDDTFLDLTYTNAKKESKILNMARFKQLPFFKNLPQINADDSKTVLHMMEVIDTSLTAPENQWSFMASMFYGISSTATANAQVVINQPPAPVVTLIDFNTAAAAPAPTPVVIDHAKNLEDYVAHARYEFPEWKFALVMFFLFKKKTGVASASLPKINSWLTRVLARRSARSTPRSSH